jgi:hypothetical protein
MIYSCSENSKNLISDFQIFKQSAWMYEYNIETRNFGDHCQYTVKKCKICFTLLTSMIDMWLTWTENKFQNLIFECHVDNKKWFTSQFFEVTEKWCPKFRGHNCIIHILYTLDTINQKNFNLWLPQNSKMTVTIKINCWPL